MTILLGKGRLTWSGNERRSDRYGTIYLLETGDSLSHDFSIAPLAIPTHLLGTIGTIVAHVTDNSHPSTHIGDLFHGVYPTTPEIGESIVLGHGLLFVDAQCEGYYVWQAVGVIPTDNRRTLWLDIHALYRAHEQTVVLEFVS